MIPLRMMTVIEKGEMASEVPERSSKAAVGFKGSWEGIRGSWVGLKSS